MLKGFAHHDEGALLLVMFSFAENLEISKVISSFETFQLLLVKLFSFSSVHSSRLPGYDASCNQVIFEFKISIFFSFEFTVFGTLFSHRELRIQVFLRRLNHLRSSTSVNI